MQLLLHAKAAQVAVMVRHMTLTHSAAVALRTHKHVSLSAGGATNESDPEKAVMKLHAGQCVCGLAATGQGWGQMEAFQATDVGSKQVGSASLLSVVSSLGMLS